LRPVVATQCADLHWFRFSSSQAFRIQQQPDDIRIETAHLQSLFNRYF
jgi:hypothetical protein